MEAAEQRLFGKIKMPDFPGGLGPGESWWTDHYLWLKDCGYLLRPRYAPDWVPSWRGTNKDWGDFEDSQSLENSNILDAARIMDGAFVTLKQVRTSRHPYEAAIGGFLSSEPLRSDPHNHCVPIYEVLQVPDDDDKILLVMPLLRSYNSPRFDTFGETVDFFKQIFEGLQFMHKHHVAHRDGMGFNIMLDPSTMYPDSFHPVERSMKRDYSGRAHYYTRTQRPPKYYFIDFGISRRYDPKDGPPLEDPIWGGDKTVPEFQISDEPCNPFPTDIYYVGNMIRKDFIQSRNGFEFMSALVADMVQDDPTKRPTADELVARMDDIGQSLSNWKLRSRVVKKNDIWPLGLYRSGGHWVRRTMFIATGTPAIPTARKA